MRYDELKYLKMGFYVVSWYLSFFISTDAKTSTSSIRDTIATKPDLIDEMATQLDQTSRVTKNWRHLGNEFGIRSERLKEIESGRNPTKDLLEYIYTSMESFTVRSFCDLMTKLGRGDVPRKWNLEG